MLCHFVCKLIPVVLFLIFTAFSKTWNMVESWTVNIVGLVEILFHTMTKYLFSLT
jgi:hypothetical protein